MRRIGGSASQCRTSFALCSKSWCNSRTSTVLLGPRLAEPNGRFFRKWDNAAKEAVAKVAVLVCTADVAMKSFAGDVLYPANILFRHCTCKGLWDDEAQRLPLATVAAHAAHVPSLGLSGDQGQRVSLHEELAGWAAGRSGQVSEQLTQWADQFLLQERRATESVPAPPPPRAPDDQSERIAPLHLNTVALWRLTCCKRFGDPLLSFIRLILPKLAKEPTPMPGHKGTYFRSVYYSSDWVVW